MSATANFRFHGELSEFLPPARRGVAFPHACARAATLKNAIEALGVPHTDVGRVLVNGGPATQARTVRDGDAIEVMPWLPGTAALPSGEIRLIADAHLGGLARFLRMLGFDTVHDSRLHDAQICSRAQGEHRVVLTRDRALLMRRDVAFGCFVRPLKTEEQLRFVAERYGLARAAHPFTRCLRCNVPLDPIEREAIEHRLPRQVREDRRQFAHCAACDRVYWPGTHYRHMLSVLRDLLPLAQRR